MGRLGEEKRRLMPVETRPPDSLPHVVIVGGGFGGLAAARALRRAPVRVTLIDRTNHHLFQPLLYQVATCVLSSVEIAAPIRHLLRRQKNASVEMTGVVGVDPQKRVVSVGQRGSGARPVHYDYLILATGATGSYFGHDEWAKLAPYPKTVADVLTMRDKILKLFELAETEDDPSQHRDLLTFVAGGGGPHRSGDGGRPGHHDACHPQVRVPPHRSRFGPDCPGRRRPAHPGRLLGNAGQQDTSLPDAHGCGDSHRRPGGAGR